MRLGRRFNSLSNRSESRKLEPVSRATDCIPVFHVAERRARLGMCWRCLRGKSDRSGRPTMSTRAPDRRSAPAKVRRSVRNSVRGTPRAMSLDPNASVQRVGRIARARESSIMYARGKVAPDMPRSAKRLAPSQCARRNGYALVRGCAPTPYVSDAPSAAYAVPETAARETLWKPVAVLTPRFPLANTTSSTTRGGRTSRR